MKINDIKNKILTLAIQGKLVPQNPSDKPARVLLEKIKAEKEQLIKEKKIKKEKPLPEIGEDEKEFEIPEGWEWCRLREIAIIKGGKRIPAGNKLSDIPTGYKYIRVADMKNGTIDENNIKYISEDIYKIIKNYIIESDDIYITIAGTIGRVGLVPEKFNGSNLTENAAKIKPYFANKEFVFRVISSEVVQQQISDKTKKVGQPKLALNQIESIVLPLPPLEEQQRIVAKIEELFKIVDALGENKEAMLKSIAATRNKVLKFAIEGKLTEQEEGDEPASILLDKIAKEKEQLIKEKKIKKEKPLPEISEEEKVFEIPKGWEWCRLNDVSSPAKYSFVDGPFGSNLKREHYVDEGIRIIQLQNVGEGIWKDTNKIYTSIEKADELIRCNAYPGELVIAKMNPIARATIIPDKEDRYVLCSDCVKLRPAKSISVNYLEYLMNSNYMKNKASEDGTGTTRQRTSLGKLKSMPIPLPPLEEQHRIVSKVDELMEYLNSLEKMILAEEII